MGLNNVKMPTFSIVTVCYNSEKTIERTIKSVLKQNYKDFEYLIVDGASTDDTMEIVRRYEPLFEGRMKWISERDQGIYDAFNKGCRAAKGTYVWIVNSDDFIESNALSTIKDLLSDIHNDLPIISAAMNYIDEETGKLIKVYYQTKESSLACYKHDQTNVTHPATLVPKSVYEKYGYFDENYKLLADCEWAHRLYGLGVPFLFIDKVITNMSNAGISSQWTWKRYKISLHDRNIYFSKYYKNPVQRKLKLYRWKFAFLKELIKNKIGVAFL